MENFSFLINLSNQYASTNLMTFMNKTGSYKKSYGNVTSQVYLEELGQGILDKKVRVRQS